MFTERFLLPVFAASLAAIMFANPFHFDLKQRIIVGLALFFVAWFIAHTVELSRKTSASTIPNANEKSAEEKRKVVLLPEPSAKASRVFLPSEVTPKYLRSLFTGVSMIQATNNLKPYVGKWMKWTGPVENVRHTGIGAAGTAIIFRENTNGKRTLSQPIILGFFDDDWEDRVSVLPIDKTITIQGEFGGIDGPTTTLRHCEIISE